MFQSGTSDSCLADLMRAAQVGDTRACAQLLRTIAPRLRDIVLAQSIFLSAEDVEDFVQDLLLSLHALRATYDPRQPFMAWLLAITQNRLVYAARQYGGQPARRVQVDIPPPISNDSANIGTEDYMDSGGDSSPPPGPSEAIESICTERTTSPGASLSKHF